jgi:hypothetical protein
MLIVADGRKLNMIDYEKPVESWPIGNSPLGICSIPTQDLGRSQGGPKRCARPCSSRPAIPSGPNSARSRSASPRSPSAPAGLLLQGWTVIDAQNNRTTVKLSNQRFNVAVADSAFTFRSAAGPRAARARPFIGATGMDTKTRLQLRVVASGFPPVARLSAAIVLA